WMLSYFSLKIMAKPSIFSPPPQGFPHARHRSEREWEHWGCSRASDAPGAPGETTALRHAPEFCAPRQTPRPRSVRPAPCPGLTGVTVTPGAAAAPAATVAGSAGHRCPPSATETGARAAG